ncbi:MAG TPA: hypothetical protein VGH99_14590 [Pseudonocardia sp.]
MWLLLVLGLVSILIALLLGSSAYRDWTGTNRGEAGERTRITAQVVEDVDYIPNSDGRGASVPVPARVHWVGADGVPHDAVSEVRGPRRAGDPVALWVDRNAQPVPAELSDDDVLFLVILCALLGLVVDGILLVGLWHGVTRWTLARNCAGWEREWASIEPRWSGRASST